jgi:hypothetical protein
MRSSAVTSGSASTRDRGQLNSNRDTHHLGGVAFDRSGRGNVADRRDRGSKEIEK